MKTLIFSKHIIEMTNSAVYPPTRYILVIHIKIIGKAKNLHPSSVSMYTMNIMHCDDMNDTVVIIKSSYV